MNDEGHAVIRVVDGAVEVKLEAALKRIDPLRCGQIRAPFLVMYGGHQAQNGSHLSRIAIEGECGDVGKIVESDGGRCGLGNVGRQQAHHQADQQKQSAKETLWPGPVEETEGGCHESLLLRLRKLDVILLRMEWCIPVAALQGVEVVLNVALASDGGCPPPTRRGHHCQRDRHNDGCCRRRAWRCRRSLSSTWSSCLLTSVQLLSINVLLWK